MPVQPPFDFRAAIADGGLDRLQDGPAHGKRLLATQALDGDGAAALALANALLASEHGQSTVADAEEAAAAALRATPPVPARTGMAESARALAALAAGRLEDAQAAAGRARAAAPELPEARFASGRVSMHAGAVTEARATWRRRPRRAPRLTAARLDLAALLHRCGRAQAAISPLEELLAADKELLRGRLLLAEARRAAVVRRAGR